MRTATPWVLLSTGLWLTGGGLTPAILAAQRIDYLLPSSDHAAALSAAATASDAPVCLGCGVEQVDHQDFDRNVHRLWRHPGRHVAVLLPDVRPRDALSPDEVEKLIDLLDLAYDAFADLLQGEPEGDGLLPIAFIPGLQTSRALLATKGVEIQGSLEGDIRRLLDDEALHWVLLHEMGHNFDFYSGRTGYLFDHFHAWTFFTDHYLPYFNRSGETAAGLEIDRAGFERPPRSPREFLRFSLAGAWRPFAEDPSSDWDLCVKRGECFWWANQSWAGFHLHMASLFGVQATRDVFAYLARTVRGAAFIPSGAEAREEIWLEAWAEATQSDVSCYAEVLRWHTSETLRDRLQQRFGTHAPLCEDRDGDGYRGIEGDCDDRDPAIHPGRDELANGADDDCDGHLDEQSVRERKGPSQEVALPGQVAAFGKRRGKKKEFVLQPSSAGVVWAETCYHGTGRGWFFFLDGKAEGGADGATGACVYGKVATDGVEPIRLRHDVHARGGYDLIVSEGDPWPVPWSKISEPAPSDSRVRLSVQTDLDEIDEKPTHVRFWVSGAGWVATKKYRRRSNATWNAPSDTPPGRYGVRAQLLRDGVPVSQVSPMRIFRIE